MFNSGIDLLHPTNWLGVVGRLALAVFVGGMIGWERETDRKPAGLRTHMLVSLGSALFVMTSIQTGMVQQTADTMSRIIQGIVTGIGFLGAGEIFEKSHSETGRVWVRGLTSAAATWVSAALGIASGCGLWFMALVGASMTFLILWGVKRLENRQSRL